MADPPDSGIHPPSASAATATPASAEQARAEPPPPMEPGLTLGQSSMSASPPPGVPSGVPSPASPPPSPGEVSRAETPRAPDPFRAGTIQISLLLYPDDGHPSGRNVFIAVRSVDETGDPPPIIRLARSDEVFPLGAYLEGVIAQLQADMRARAEAAQLVAAEAQHKAAMAPRPTAARPAGAPPPDAQPHDTEVAPPGGRSVTSPSPQHPPSRARSRTATPPSSPPAFQQLALEGL
jgi:hypothetical protein